MSRGISQISSGFLSDVFACPDCHGSLVEQQGADGAFLVCEACRTAAPIVDGLVHFNETVSLTRFENTAAIEVDPQAYSRFVEQAWRRPVFEPYAAFAPFNEATRALYPLIQTLRAHLTPDDVIVDVWCRTGWT